MDRTLNTEAREILASVRATLLELAEEGVEHDPVAAAAAAAGQPAEPRPAATAAPRQATPAPRQSERAPEQPAASIVSGDDAQAWEDCVSLEQVRERLGECTRCGLCEGRKTIVFGSGNANADLMFIGEGPGQQEDMQGLPFVGPAGELLTQMIERGMGIPRSDVYICNIVKCRPPGNRNPLPDEIAACRPFLDGQIQAVRPKVIVSLGKPAASLLLGREVAITRTRGTWQSYQGVPLMPTLHPAFILRQYTQENRRLVWEDLKAAKARCES